MKPSTLLKYTLAFTAAILSFLPVQAQQKNDQNALYIFRNDGGFNAFFFADIERIEYSKIDTLGVEQNDYVVQEIYALDSIFRIPVSAIDSVAFVTPKNIVKADVVCPDKSVTDYIVASDSVSWFRLSASAPSSVIPKVGDKLLIEDSSDYLPNGFSGKVTKITNGSDGYRIDTEELGLLDLFDRFISKTASGNEAPSKARTRGVDAIDEQFIMDEPIELPSFSGSMSIADIEGEGFKSKDEYFGMALEGSFSGSYSIEPTISSFRTFIYADIVEGVKVYQYLKMNRKEDVTFTASGQLGANLDIPWKIPEKAIKKGILDSTGKKLTRKIGNQEFEFSYGFFINGKITMSGSISHKKEGFGLTTMSYDEPVAHVPQKEDFFSKSTFQYVSDEFEAQGWAHDFSVSTGVYAKVGTKIGFLRRTFETELRFEAGVRLQENIVVALNDMQITPKLETGKLYSTLNTDEGVSLSVYGSGAFTAKLKLTENVNWIPVNLGGELTLYKKNMSGIVPDMKSISWEVDKKAPWRGTLTVPLKRSLLFPRKVGLAVYDFTDEKNPVEAIDFWKTAEYYSPQTYTQLKELMEDFEPSRTYKAWPQVKVCAYPLLADQEVEIKLGDPMMDIKPKAVEFDENPGYKEIEVITNVKNTEFTTEATWLNEIKPVWNNEEGRLTVYAPELPDGTDSRKGYVIGVGYDKEGKELLRDTITVTQLRPILQASPNPVEFEQKGGTVKVTLNTTLTQIEAKIQEGGNLDQFFTMTLNSDNTITVTAPENTTGQELSGNIIVKGSSPNGQKAELNLNVIQKADEGETGKYWIKASPESVTFDKAGGSQQITITDNLDDEALQQDLWINAVTAYPENEDKWLQTGWVDDDYNDIFSVSAGENTTGRTRNAIIYFQIYNEDKSFLIEKAVPVSQTAEGAFINMDYITYVDFHIKGNFNSTVLHNSDTNTAQYDLVMTHRFNNITKTNTDKGIHIESVDVGEIESEDIFGYGDIGSGEGEFRISFDISVSGSEIGKITNLTYSEKWSTHRALTDYSCNGSISVSEMYFTGYSNWNLNHNPSLVTGLSYEYEETDTSPFTGEIFDYQKRTVSGFEPIDDDYHVFIDVPERPGTRGISTLANKAAQSKRIIKK